MAKEVKKQENKSSVAEQPKAKAEDVQAFVQRKLQILNQKSGARYERDAARVIRCNLQGGTK